MLSKVQSKHIRSLSHQKFRDEYGEFVVEGAKIVAEWLQSPAHIKTIVATQDWYDNNTHLLIKANSSKLAIASKDEISSISSLQTPPDVLIVVDNTQSTQLIHYSGWHLALDRIQDPGNLGTIIRIADWFGIEQIICSPGCVNAYNPKVIQSAMGSHLRVNIVVQDLKECFRQLSLPVYAAVLGGQNIYQQSKENKGIILIGNESKGIDTELINIAEHKVTIPRIGKAESLNAAVATGILCAAIMQR
jgi:TrmH family RNA methyltransferase